MIDHEKESRDRDEEAREMIFAHGSDAIKDALIKVLFEPAIVMSKSYNGFRDDEGEEYRYDKILLDVGDATDADVQSYVDDRWPSEHCQHEHDCCGNWYQQRAMIDRSGKFAVITLAYSLNI